jgi:hypothetical protein
VLKSLAAAQLPLIGVYFTAEKLKFNLEVISLNIELDHYDDSELQVVRDSNSIPGFVKEASLQPKSDHDRFALSILTKEGDVTNKFPISSESSVWLSARYFDENHNKLSKEAKETVAANIKEAAKRYEVKVASNAINEYAKESNSNYMVTEEKAISETDNETFKTAEYYALPSRNEYPIDNEGQIKEATNYFEKYAREFTLDERKEYCENLEKRANELNMSINSNDVKRYASATDTDSQFLKLALEARKEYVDDDEFEETLDVIFEKQSNFPPSMLVDIIEEFDKEANIKRLWNKDIPDPQESVKGNIDKTAATEPESDVVTYHGKSVSADNIQNIDESKLEQHFDQTQIDELMNNPIDVFNALPEPHKEIIIKYI